MSASRRGIWLIAPALVVIGVFLVVPYLNIVLMSLRPPAVGAPYGTGFTATNFTRILTDAYFLGVLADTVWLGCKPSVAATPTVEPMPPSPGPKRT